MLLFGHRICPYCCKTKALLQAQGVAFSEVEVSPLTKAQIKWSLEYKKVPIAVFASDGAVVNDSAAIADALFERFGAAPKLALLPTGAPAGAADSGGSAGATFDSAEARQWAAWSTEKLAVYMYPNMTRSFAECRQALAYFSDPALGLGALDALLTQTVGALGMSLAHGKVKAKYGIEDERASLWEAVDEWGRALEAPAAAAPAAGPFRGGAAAPDWGDVAVFGVLQSCKGLPLAEEIVGRSAALGTWAAAMGALLEAPNEAPKKAPKT